MGRLGEVLGLKDVLNKTSHGLRTVRENHFGSVNCKTALGLLKEKKYQSPSFLAVI
jgi:hypothetical protein